MKKLTLDVEALVVESFRTHAVEGAGTVHGAAAVAGNVNPIAQTYPNCSQIDACPSALGCTYQASCNDPTCAGQSTCGSTCAGTCAGINTGCGACSGPYCVADV